MQNSETDYNGNNARVVKTDTVYCWDEQDQKTSKSPQRTDESASNTGFTIFGVDMTWWTWLIVAAIGVAILVIIVVLCMKLCKEYSDSTDYTKHQQFMALET